MKFGTIGYGIGFLIFVVLVAVVAIQNIGGTSSFSFLWMKVSLFTLLYLVMAFGILQGIFFVLLLKSFFTGMQRPELTKFDLDKPL